MIDFPLILLRLPLTFFCFSIMKTQLAESFLIGHVIMDFDQKTFFLAYYSLI